MSEEDSGVPGGLEVRLEVHVGFLVGEIGEKNIFTPGSGFPGQGVSTFSWLPDVDWSDHASFRAFGYPCVMVTDTALYRYPYYHTPSDTPETLDYLSRARVTYGIYKAVSRLASE